MEERALRQDVDAIKEDLSRLRTDLGGMTQQWMSRAREGMGEAAEYAQDQGSEALSVVQHQIEDHPLTAVGIALGVGLLLGAMLKR
jgi:ElaB/YqjD/DUF883 family membrane-anchored ribosome-binding protein